MEVPGFRFYNPVKIIAGAQALKSIGSELKQLSARRPILITDQGVVQAGLVELVKQSLAEAQQNIGAIYDQVPPDSSPQAVNEVVRVFRENDCDSIISIGGGSVIDSAKAANAVLTEGADDLREIVGKKLRKPMGPFIAIPTTSGTGAEVSYAAMIRDAQKEEKILLASYLLFPNVAILDPRMTLSLPPFVTAATAMDALAHAVEGFICKQKNPFSDAHSLEAIRLIQENLIKVLQDGSDEQGRFNLANAATLAGASFSNAGVGLIHALGHALGGVCHIAHGVAINIFLPHGLAYNMSKVAVSIGELLLPLAGPEVYVATASEKRPYKTLEAIRAIQDEVYALTQLPRTLAEAGVEEDLIGEIAQKAVADPALYFNPLKVNIEDIAAILKKAC